jgi:hypothetical protein
MADKRITVSLDMLTDDAKKALDSFLQQVVKSTSTVNNSMGDFGKFGTNVTDSFKRSVNEIIGLQKQLQDAMKSTGRTLFEPQSRESSMNALNEGLKKIVQDKLDGIKREISIARDADKEASRMLAEYVAGVGAGAPMDEITNDEIRKASERKTETSRHLERLENEARRIDPANGGPGPGGKEGDALKTLNTLAVAGQLLASGGDLTKMIGSLQTIPTLLGALLGKGGNIAGMVATAAYATGGTLQMANFNQYGTAAAAARQYGTGGDLGITSQFFTRQAMKRDPTGAYAQFMQGNLPLSSIPGMAYNWATTGDRNTAWVMEANKLLEQQMGSYGPEFQQSFSHAQESGNAMYGVERMFGTNATQRARSGLEAMGIPLDRIAAGGSLLARYSGRLPGAADAALINAQNRFGLGDMATQELFRANARDPQALNNLRGMMGFAGLGTPQTDMATGMVSEAAAQYGGQFDVGASQQAQMTFFAGFQRTNAALGGPTSALSPTEISRYSNVATGNQLGVLSTPGNLEDITQRAALNSMGITDPIAISLILSMPPNDPRRYQAIQAATKGKVGSKQAQSISGAYLSRLRTQQNALGGDQAKAVLGFAGGEASKIAGHPVDIDLMGALQTPGMLRDVSAAAAASAATPSAITAAAGLTPSAGLAPGGGGGGLPPGRQDTLADLVKEQNAVIASFADTVTHMFDRTLNVRVVEMTTAAKNDMASAGAKRTEDIRVQNAPAPKDRTNSHAKPGQTTSADPRGKI